MEDNPWIGNYHGYKEFISWLTQPINDTKLSYSSICIILGPSGIGKTYGIKEICNRYNKILHIIDSNKITNFKECKEYIYKLCQSNITSQFEKNLRKQQILCIEELETLLSLDRTFLHSLQKLLDTNIYHNIPFIITCQMQDKKKIYEYFSKSKIIELHIPSEADLLLFLRKKSNICKADVLLTIAEQCNGNIGNALYMLEMEERNNKETNNIIDSGKIENIPSLIELYKNPKPELAVKIFYEDPWLHPLRFHENLPHELKQRKGLQVKKNQVYIQILKGICIWDYFMSNQKLDDMSMPINFIAYYTIFLEMFERKKQTDDIHDNFTKMFSHLSLEKKNQIISYQDQWENIGSYHKSILENNNKKKKFSV